MKVTEHNLDDCDLTIQELKEVIRIVMKELKSYKDDLPTQMYYAKIVGKLYGIAHTLDDFQTGTEETTITNL